MQRFISIREKLVLFFILLGIISIGIVGYFSYSNARSAILNRTFDQLTSLRIEKKKQIELFFAERKKDVNLLFLDENIKKLFSDSAAFSRHISNFLNPDIYSGIYLLIPETKTVHYVPLGTQSIHNNDLTYDNLFNSIISNSNTNEPSLSDYKNDKNDIAFNSVILTKYYAENDWWIILPIATDAINKIMYEKNPYNGLGKTGETYLVGSDSLMRSTSRFNQNSVYKIKVNTIGVQNAFKGIINTMIIDDYRNIKVLSSFDKIETPGINWVILAEMDWNEVLIPVYTFRNYILLVSLIISVLFIIIAYIVSLGITRTIIRLNSAVSEVGNGNFNVNLEISANDEIGELTRSFNKMASQLKLSSEQLKDERINRSRSMIDGQEIERQRLSRELHDGLGQQMIGLRLKIENLANRCEGNTAKIASEVGKIMDKTIEEVRRMSNDLMPAVLQEFGVANAIRNLCDQITDASDIKIEISITGSFELLNPKQKTYLFRIVQEAVNNVVKHSKATLLLVKLNQNNSTVQLEIEDNGIGCSNEPKNDDSHNGINNMKERATLLNGVLKIQTSPEKGTKVRLTFPLNDENNTGIIS